MDNPLQGTTSWHITANVMDRRQCVLHRDWVSCVIFEYGADAFQLVQGALQGYVETKALHHPEELSNVA